MGLQKTMDQNHQKLNVRPNKPSKYKQIFPTPLAKLQKTNPAKYKSKWVYDQDKDVLHDGVSVKIVYENEEELWLTVESVPDDDDKLVYCKVTSQVKFARQIQKNQRVSITRDVIVAVHYHDDDDC